MDRAGETSLKELPNEEEWTKDLEKVSFMKCDIRRIGEGVSPDCPKLSTLLLSENLPLKVLPDSFFSKMQGLCTLDLCGSKVVRMSKQFFEAFWPKFADYVAEQGLNNVLIIKDFEDTLKELQDNLKLLSAIAFDVENEIENAEDFRRKERKREAEVWLEGVKSTIPKVEELGSEAKSKGFMMRFLVVGKAAQLNADIDKLVRQRLHIGDPVLDARGSRGQTLLTNGMVGDAFIENPEMVLNRMEDRQVSHTPMAPSPTQTPPSRQTPMAPSPSQTPPSPPPLMQFLQYVVPTMLVFLTMRYGAKPEALFGKHRMPLSCFITTTSIYWLTAGVMKQMAPTTNASQICYLVLNRIALASGIQSLLFLLSMFLNHVPPTMISLLISAPIALLIVHFFIKMVFGAGGRNSTNQPVRLQV